MRAHSRQRSAVPRWSGSQYSQSMKNRGPGGCRTRRERTGFDAVDDHPQGLVEQLRGRRVDLVADPAVFTPTDEPVVRVDRAVVVAGQRARRERVHRQLQARAAARAGRSRRTRGTACPSCSRTRRGGRRRRRRRGRSPRGTATCARRRAELDGSEAVLGGQRLQAVLGAVLVVGLEPRVERVVDRGAARAPRAARGPTGRARRRVRTPRRRWRAADRDRRACRPPRRTGRAPRARASLGPSVAAR